MVLYEIAQQYRDFMAAVESGDIPQEFIKDTLDSLDGAFDDKAEAVACMVKELRAQAQAIKNEENALSDRRASKESSADHLENYLYNQLKAIGRDKFETPRARVKFTKGERVALLDEIAFIVWAKKKAKDLLNFKEPTPNKTAIKAALKDGRKLRGASIEKTERAKVG